MKRRSRNGDAFSTQRLMLLITGVWPVKNPTRIYRISELFVIFVLASATNISLLMNFYSSNVEKASQRLRASFLGVDFVCYQMKLVMFYVKKRSFLKLLDELENPLFGSYGNDLEIFLDETIKITKLIVKTFLCSCIVTISSFILLPLFDYKNSRSLPLPFPFDMAEQPKWVYFSVYVFQSLALIVGAWNSVAFDNLASSMMGIVSAQLKGLTNAIIRTINLKNLFKFSGSLDNYGNYDYIIYNKLKGCVKYHNAIIGLAKSIEDIFKYGFLMQFLTSIVVICFTGFTFATTQPGSPQFLFSISFFGSLMIEIAIGCIYGNDVIIQSSKVTEACYMSEWTDCGSSARQILFMIMERSKRPLTLTAGKFVTLSLSSLIGILRSAISYAAVLRQIYNES